MNDEHKSRFQVQGRVKVINGSVLMPETAGLRFVLNFANMAGKTDDKLYEVLSKKWPKARQEVRGWFATKTGKYKPGATHTLPVQSDTWVVSLLCQDENLKTDLNGLELSLKDVCKQALYEKASVHVSSILTSQVPEFQELLTKQLVDNGVSVYYYNEV